VRTIAYEGRPAWVLDVDTAVNKSVPQFLGDRLQITVDEETGMPLRVVETKGGSVLHQVRLDALRVNKTVPVDAFALAFPAGAEIMRSDEGFRRSTLDEAARVVGYDPLVPSFVPSGFALGDVAAARDAAPTGTGGVNPESRMVVSVAYRAGFEQFLVTTRLRGPGEWKDPLAAGQGIVDDEQPVSLDRGALAGAEARIVVAPGGTPHLWAETSKLVVTVSGDLSRQELVDVARSLTAKR
jgi:hypothetical protein